MSEDTLNGCIALAVMLAVVTGAVTAAAGLFKLALMVLA